MENSIDINSQLVQYYEEYENNTIEIRSDSETNRDYYDNKQWADTEIRTLKNRKQPVITFNLVKRTIDSLLGIEQENRTDPKALPRTPQHEEDANAITDAIRYVVDNCDFDQIASEGFKNLLLEGTEGADIQVVRKGDEYEVKIYFVPWDRMFWDVHSRKLDFSDAKYKGIVIWMDYEDARAKKNWDQDAVELAITTMDSLSMDTHDDKPIKWNDNARKRIRVCLINYLQDGVWHYCYFTKGANLSKPKPIEYLDEDDNPVSFLEFQSAYIDREGNRYSYTSALRSPQDEVNKRRSKALHLMNVRQTYGNQMIGEDATQLKEEMAKPDGHIDLKNGKFGEDFGIIPTNDIAQSNLLLLEEAKEAFNVVGANTSVTGKEDRVMSGRAELMRQQAGFRELMPVMDSHRHWKKRIYRQIWNRIRQYWKGEKYVRVTDDESNMRWVGLNRPITLGEKLQNELPPEELQYLDPNDPRLQQVVGYQNQLSELDVDILIEDTPDVGTIREDTYNKLLEIARFRPEVPFEALIETSPLRNKDKDKVIEKIKGNEEQQQMAMQEQQEIAQIEKDNKIADTEAKRSKAAKDLSDAKAQELENMAVERGIVSWAG